MLPPHRSVFLALSAPQSREKRDPRGRIGARGSWINARVDVPLKGRDETDAAIEQAGGGGGGVSVGVFGMDVHGSITHTDTHCGSCALPCGDGTEPGLIIWDRVGGTGFQGFV